jgi:hypothetical protein
MYTPLKNNEVSEAGGEVHFYIPKEPISLLKSDSEAQQVQSLKKSKFISNMNFNNDSRMSKMSESKEPSTPTANPFQGAEDKIRSQ